MLGATTIWDTHTCLFSQKPANHSKPLLHPAVMAAMGDTAVRVREVLAKPWVGVPLAFSLS